ncbi:MAG: histone deacetylase [Myxococcota bacterium]
MSPLLVRLLARVRGPLPAWYHPDYRLPIPSLEARTGAEPRRADYVAWHLDAAGALPAARLRTPEPIAWEDLCRVHTAAWLEKLGDPAAVASVFGAEPWEVRADELVRVVRLACGGTLAAARHAVAHGGPTLNLLGGFHHAFPDKGGGLCPVNDVAVAIAALRATGFAGRVAVIDLDAHPPDGTAACLAGDPAAWIGSISASDWGPLPPGVDETVLPDGAGDDAYLDALDGLLARMPEDAALVFVLAGGDVLAGDRMGRLGLTLDGAGERDRRVLRRVADTASVWTFAGGYHRDAWRLAARTAMLLATRRLVDVPADVDPLRARFRAIARGIRIDDLGGALTAADLDEALGGHVEPRLLGHYTPAGVEFALHRYGFLDHLRRLGYERFRVAIDTVELGDRVRVHGAAGGAEHVLLEAVLARARVAEREVLFVHWLTLRDPRAPFRPTRPRLPGQEVPGLGLARETGELLARIADRLGLAGVAWRPMHFHTAYTARHDFVFADPVVEGRFRALVRDAGDRPLADVSRAVAEGRVRLNGAPWAWQPEVMVYWPERPRPDARVEATREGARFTLDPA